MTEEIAIIGGGLAGCLTALMLAKQCGRDGTAKYHVTVIDSNSCLLDGASCVGFRLHLGGEYALDPNSMHDCLSSAMIHRILLPDAIYASTPGMQFLIANGTEKIGSITVDGFNTFYEKHVRQRYEEALGRMQQVIGPDSSLLFGPPDVNKFFYPLAPIEYQHLQKGVSWPYQISGGFQTSEPGLCLPRFLTAIRKAVEKHPSISVLLNHTAQEPVGTYPEFVIPFEDGHTSSPFSQIVQAAWHGGPALSPLHRPVTVYRRAILRVKLSDGPFPPAFILQGEHGGMFAPESQTSALVYLPRQGAAYVNECTLSNSVRQYPPNWHSFPAGCKPDQYREHYFKSAIERFPEALRSATSSELIVRETLNFNTRVEQRQYESPLEVEAGRFVLYPTKATYAARIALQTAAGVEMRSNIGGSEPAIEHHNKDSLSLLLRPNIINRYSLNDISVDTDNQNELISQILDPADIPLITEKVLRHPLLFQSILDALKTPLNILGADGRFWYVNPSYARAYGMRPGDIIGQTVEKIIGDEGASTIRAYTRCALNGVPIHYTRPLKLATGIRYIKCCYLPLEEDAKRGWLGIIQFTTDT